MTTTTTTKAPATPDLEALADRVQRAKNKVAEYKVGYHKSLLTYEDLAEAGKELSNAMFEYSKAKYPAIKPKRIPYQAIIR